MRRVLLAVLLMTGAILIGAARPTPAARRACC